MCAKKASNKMRRKMSIHEFTSRGSIHPARVPNVPPIERRRKVIPIPVEIVSTARDATNLPPPWQLQSPVQPVGGGYEAPGSSAMAIRPACTALAVRPSTDQSDSQRKSQGGQQTRTSSEVPSKLRSSGSSTVPVFPGTPNKTTARTCACPHRAQAQVRDPSVHLRACRKAPRGASHRTAYWRCVASRSAADGQE
ncbi:hypothetical protein H4582DRAFT_1010591 [Lactarius indigo]|nr:hypothetical protein H4582DRAFT_1010591 [Lactarius indigo]